MARALLLTLAFCASSAWSVSGTAAALHGVTLSADQAARGEQATEQPQETESIWGPIARLFNFLVLAGVLYYFARQPIATYLAERSGQIRRELVTASEMEKTAASQIAELERKMAALPGEIALLKTRGQEEIAAEEARIQQAAAAERERLLEQTRREIDLQLRVAHRELVEHASNLAVGLATDRIKKTITPDDQARLVDRYLQQVK